MAAKLLALPDFFPFLETFLENDVDLRRKLESAYHVQKKKSCEAEGCRHHGGEDGCDSMSNGQRRKSIVPTGVFQERGDRIKSIVVQGFAEAFGGGNPVLHDGKPGREEFDATTPEERHANLPPFLRNVEGYEGDDKYEKMSDTWNRTIREYLDSAKATSDWMFAWGISEMSMLGQFVMATSNNQSTLLTQAKVGLAVRCLTSVALTYIDWISDVLIAKHFLEQSEMLPFAVTLAFPAIVLLTHAFVAFANREGIPMIIISLLGGKPIVDTWRVVSGEKIDFEKFAFPPIMIMAMGRCAEMVFESIPAAFIQLFFIVKSFQQGNPVAFIQYLGVMSSLFSTGFIGANVDYDLDKSEYFRRVEKYLYGWLPESKIKRFAFLLLTTFFLSAFCGMRVLGCVMLGTVKPIALGAWIASEFTVFTLLKMFWFDTYIFFKPMPATRLFHVATYIFSHFLPCFTIRNFYFTVTGRHWTLTLAYGYISAFLMLFTAYTQSEESDSESNQTLRFAVIICSSCTIVSLASLSIIKAYIMKKKYDWLWWTTKTPADHFSDYIWDNNIYEMWGPTLDDHRAIAISVTFIPKYYLHDERVKVWLTGKWGSWERDPPFWFNDNFIGSLPLSLVPRHVSRMRVHDTSFHRMVLNQTFDHNDKKAERSTTVYPTDGESPTAYAL